MIEQVAAGRRLPARLVHDRRAVTAIEFVVVAGPLLALMIAIEQVSVVMALELTGYSETATATASRQLMTGVDQQLGLSQAQFKQSVCAQLPSFMKCANLMVDVSSTADFASASTSTPTLTFDANGNINNTWNYAPGGANQITTVRAMYIWQVSKGPLGFDLSTMSGSNRLLIATAVFKTEPAGG